MFSRGSFLLRIAKVFELGSVTAHIPCPKPGAGFLGYLLSSCCNSKGQIFEQDRAIYNMNWILFIRHTSKIFERSEVQYIF